MKLVADLRDQLREVFDRALADELQQSALLDAARHDSPTVSSYRSTLASLGLYSLCVDARAEGLEADLGTLAALFEVAGERLLPSVAREETVVLAPMLAIAALRGDAACESWLAALRGGSLSGGGRAFVPAAAGTARLRESGDSALLSLDGASMWLGPNARVAHVLTPTWAAILDLETSGMSVEPVRRALDPGQGLCRVSCSDVPIPATRLVRDGEAAALLLEWEVAAFAEMLGCGAHLLAATVAYSLERRQFGQRIASFQAISHRLADMAVSVEGVRSALARLVSLGESGGDAAALAASLRYWVPWAIRGVCEGAIQVHGGLGFTWEAGLHLHYRRVLQLQATLGGAFATAREVGRSYLQATPA